VAIRNKRWVAISKVTQGITGKGKVIEGGVSNKIITEEDSSRMTIEAVFKIIEAVFNRIAIVPTIIGTTDRTTFKVTLEITIKVYLMKYKCK
jgi:hypothetical protein